MTSGCGFARGRGEAVQGITSCCTPPPFHFLYKVGSSYTLMLLPVLTFLPLQYRPQYHPWSVDLFSVTFLVLQGSVKILPHAPLHTPQLFTEHG